MANAADSIETGSPRPGGVLAQLGVGRVGAALGVGAIVAGALVAIMMQAGSAQKALLYSGLELAEAAEITGQLSQANIEYELRGDGSSIFVPRERVLDARMMLSAEGLPTRGSVGYEIFDETDALGTTSFVQNVNRVRALEGELARTIASLDVVRSARVHLVLPERRLFEREAETPSASIVVDIRGREVTAANVRAFRNLAAGAVQGLSPERVTVLDGTGKLLAAGAEGGEDGLSGTTAEERRTAYEERIRRMVRDIVTSVVGRGGAEVQVSADLDFTRVTESRELFDPDSRVVRSSELIEESDSERSSEPLNATTVGENLPDADAPPAADGPSSEAAGSRLEERFNYEISRTTRTEVQEAGRLTRLSVAVAVDHARTRNEDGSISATPRTEEELQRIEALVRSAVGFSEARGDTISVVNMPFAQPEPPPLDETEPSRFDFDRNDIMRGAELLALLIAALAVIFFVLRPLVGGLMGTARPKPAKGKGKGKGDALDGPPGAPQLTGPNSAAMEEAASAIDDHVRVANVAGQIKASSVKKIADLVQANPEESTAIVRGWINPAVKANG